MEKGKLANNKKYYTFMLIPHSSEKVASVKLSAKLVTSVVIVLSIICVSGIAVFSLDAILGTEMLLSNRHKQLRNEIANKDAEISTLLEDLNNQQAEISHIKRNLDEMDELASSIRAISGSPNRGIQASRSATAIMTDIDLDGNSESTLSLEELKAKSDSLKDMFYDICGPVSDIEDYISAKPSLWPTTSKRVTSGFGYRVDPLYPKKSQIHSGIDIANSHGSHIYAAGKGTVVFAGYQTGYGYTVIIDHGYDISSLYGHSSKILVKAGQEVSQGDIIARIGSSGRSTGAHLHFEVSVKGKAVNPYAFLKED